MHTTLRTGQAPVSETQQYETRMLAAPTAFEPLYRNTLQQLRWTVTTTNSAFGTSMLLLQRTIIARPAAQPLLERRAERALMRIAAMERHPGRVAAVTHIAGSAIAALMVGVAAVSLLSGQGAVAPIVIGAGAWLVTTIAAPFLRAWRTHRVQLALAAEYQALRNCLHP
jgi:hypothetical protein